MSQAGVGDDAVRFCAAGACDADALLALARTFHREEGHPLTAGAEAALLRIVAGEEPLARLWIVRDAAGTPSGYLILTLGYSIEYEGRDGFVDDLYLAPALRDRGVGRHLLAFALEQAEHLGIRTLHLEVEPDNGAAQALYRSVGFEETGRRLMRKRVPGR
jgi:ribosomal protein S18 acetylase RimI-like enzyme